jgi:hypothetical protein
MQLPTSDPPDSPPDHVEAALEASCDTLVVLQLLRALGADDISGAEGQATQAIRSLRAAIAELRAAQELRGSGIAAGFVVATDRPPRTAMPDVAPQSRPRRTA